ncbi:MAG: hypothetical protein ACI837_001938 [Crocinitomicaceae bacterium]|jgi:hypothetical protein
MRILLAILLFFPGALRAQNYFSDHFGGSIGIVIHLGTHVNSVGLNFKGYYTDYFYQVNTNSSLTLHASSYGGRKLFWENRNALGAALMGGKKQMTPDFLLDGLNHQTPYNYGVAYNYLWYFDKVGTTQQSGGFALHLKSFSIYHENDVFGGQGRDRFRSGHVQVSYRKDLWRYAVGVNIWTGETRGATWEKVEWDKCPHGFRVLEDLPYGKTSHGILYGSVTHSYPFGQIATMRLGIDSEQVRHGFQNRFIHDLIFLPKSVHRDTPHYPRLDETGCPVFEKDDVRKSLFFMQVGSNGNWSD